MMKKAIYAGTFDPLHLGHWDLIERGLKIFDELTVAVGVAYHKSPYLSLEQRLEILNLAKEKRNLKNLKILSFEGLLVDLCKKLEINLILRGLRDASDFTFEARLFGLNQSLNPEIETIFLATSPKYNFLNSTFLRETFNLGGDISQFLLPETLKFLAENKSFFLNN